MLKIKEHTSLHNPQQCKGKYCAKNKKPKYLMIPRYLDIVHAYVYHTYKRVCRYKFTNFLTVT